MLKITQVRSTIGTKRNQRETMRSLGLRRIRQSVVRPDDSQVRGMVQTVRHLVSVEQADRSESAASTTAKGTVR